MKVIKIQTYKKTLIFSFKEQEKIDTDLTMITTKIDLEELVFSKFLIIKTPTESSSFDFLKLI